MLALHLLKESGRILKDAPRILFGVVVEIDHRTLIGHFHIP
jgi:hypothetical protein